VKWSAVNLRPTVSRPVCLGDRCPFGTRDQFFFLYEISFIQLWVCYFVVPSMTRGRVCNLLYNCFWALSEQSLLGRSPAELTAIFYCLVWDSPHLEGQGPVFISPRNRVAQLYLRALGSLFVASYDSQGLRRVSQLSIYSRYIVTSSARVIAYPYFGCLVRILLPITNINEQNLQLECTLSR
jgi:hypothetical protein